MRRALALLFLATLGGCSAFRASAGVGFGLGASANVGWASVGVLGGFDYSFGNSYGVTGKQESWSFGLPGVIEAEGVSSEEGGHRARVGPLPFAAPLTAIILDEKQRQEVLPFMLQKPLGVGVNVYALFLGLHLGFDPQGLAYDVHRFFGLAAGWDEPDPPAPRKAISPTPEDELDETPYRLLAAEDLALVDSGTPIERQHKRSALATELEDPLTLVEAAAPEGWERWVEPRLGLAGAPLEAATLEKLAALRERDTERAFARARRARDPELLDAALARSPLAPAEARADLERLRGELLLERGDPEEALAAFADEAAHRADPEALADAKNRVALAQKIAAAAPRREIARNAWSGSADVGGVLLGAQGRAVWAVTLQGDVAWERSDVLPEGWFESKVIGAASGLALLEVQVDGRPWVAALDDEGLVRWKTPLPAAVACGSPMDQFYALARGRLFVGRLDRVLALDAASGRLLWMAVRKDVSFATQPDGKHWTDVAFDWRPVVGPPRRRPDGENGFRMRVEGSVLEVSSGRGRRTDRFDISCGKPLGD